MTAPPPGPGVRVNRRGQLSHGASKLQEKSEVTFSKRTLEWEKPRRSSVERMRGKLWDVAWKCESAVITGVRTGREATKRTSCWREAKVTAIRQPRRGSVFFRFLQNMSNHSSFCGSRLALKWIVSSPSAEFSFRSQNPISGLIWIKLNNRKVQHESLFVQMNNPSKYLQPH